MLTPESLEQRLRPLFEGTGFELVSLKIQPNPGRVKFVVTLDHRERGITVSEIESWSRRFEEVFDMADDVPRSYALDVTSPGVGHPLRQLWEYRKNLGRELTVTLLPEPGEKAGEEFKARLEEAVDDHLLFEGGRRIPMERVKHAKVALPW